MHQQCRERLLANPMQHQVDYQRKCRDEQRDAHCVSECCQEQVSMLTVTACIAAESSNPVRLARWTGRTLFAEQSVYQEARCNPNPRLDSKDLDD